jgi:hypothetical protein
MIEQSKRKAVFSELKGYCIYAGDNDYIEVTHWSMARAMISALIARMVARSLVSHTVSLIC